MTIISEGSRTGPEIAKALVPSEHFVQFYENDHFLLDSLSNYITTGLAAGQACVVIATNAHRKELEEQIQASGFDLAAARARNQYISLDAAETLSQLMVDDWPKAERFTEVIGNIITRTAQGRPHLRVFGEMVALLWAKGNPAAAIHLEKLWNDLRGKIPPFSLFCAYPMHNFAGEVYGPQFGEICKLHSHIIPDETYTALTDSDERLRIIAQLQQKATAFEAEIAERKAVEQRLRASENRYRRLFEASTDGILIVDPYTRKITDANPSMTALLGYPHDQLLGQELWQIGLLKDQEANLAFLQDLQEQRCIRYEALPLHTRDGQRLYVEFISNLFQANGHEVIQCNIRDVTDRKLAEERKNTFISMAGHELKTPLSSLRGFAQLLQRRLKQQADPQTMLFLSRMDAQIKKLANLISDLLDVSRMETGVLPFRATSFDFDELVQETVENIQAATHTHDLRIQGETGVQIYGDRDRLEQVLINLLTNAIKYSPQANTVIVHLNLDDTQIEVAVQDFGIGIAEKHHARIFERFYQAVDLLEETKSGLGIGLYIAHTIIQRHGGRLWLRSRKGTGSTFYFTLPLLDGEQKENLTSPTEG